MPLSFEEYRREIEREREADKIESRMEDPMISRTNDHIDITMPPGAEIGDLDALLRRRGLNPDEWIVANVVVNEWESSAGNGSITTLHQLKVNLKPAFNRVLPARVDGPSFKPSEPTDSGPYPKLVVQLPDQQAPYHDPWLHELVCRWLENNRPDTVVLSGDLFDFPSISKHRKNRKMHTTAQRSIDAGYEVCRDYRQATPITQEWVLLPGNHEVRLENFLLDRDAEELVLLHRAGDPEGIPLLSLAHVARLDELGIRVAESEYGTYPYPRYELTPDFDIYHGWIVRPIPGASAIATAEKTGKSTAVGHTHRAGIAYINNPVRRLIAVEGGTLARIKGGLGYEVAPNWENGFPVYRVFQNGLVHPSIASYVDGALIWEDQMYVPNASGIKLAS